MIWILPDLHRAPSIAKFDTDRTYKCRFIKIRYVDVKDFSWEFLTYGGTKLKALWLIAACQPVVAVYKTSVRGHCKALVADWQQRRYRCEKSDPSITKRLAGCQPPCISWGYRKISYIRGIKFHNLKVSHLVFQLSVPNPLKPGVKSRAKM